MHCVLFSVGRLIGRSWSDLGASWSAFVEVRKNPLIGICRVRVVYEKDSSCMEHGSSLGLFGLFGNA